MTIIEHPLFRKLASLELPVEHYVIAGSAPLLAHGLRDEINDLDIVARKAAWTKATALVQPVQAPYAGARAVHLFDGDIEILDRWFRWEADELIKNAEFIEGLPFVSLRTTMEWKRELGRPVDEQDIRILEKVLG